MSDYLNKESAASVRLCPEAFGVKLANREGGGVSQWEASAWREKVRRQRSRGSGRHQNTPTTARDRHIGLAVFDLPLHLSQPPVIPLFVLIYTSKRHRDL